MWVLGLGASGLSAARLLVRRGAKVCINDLASESTLGDRVHEARSLGAELVLGSHPIERLNAADLIVASPGIPLTKLLSEMDARVPVVSEVELASWFLRAPVVGVTGTNGKSTVTTLLGEMCKAGGRSVFVGGNLGCPLTEAIDSDANSESGCVVVELSSFQLERTERLRCKVAILLNLTEDHLDRYEGFAEYAAAKARIFLPQTSSDVALVPAEDELCMSIARAGVARVKLFGGATGEVRVEGGSLKDSVSGLSVSVECLGLRGGHNLLNASAAVLAAREMGIDAESIAKVLRDFKGLPHRMQFVRELDGIRFYDDSKATNVGATVASLDGLEGDGKVVLVAGGRDKGGDYTPLRERMAAYGRGLVVIGEATQKIVDAFEGTTLPVASVDSMNDAVIAARKLAHPGDTVLLAPACSSFDMFRSYAHRGDVFQEIVKKLPGALS